MICIIKSKKVIYCVVWRINIKIAKLTPFYLAVILPVKLSKETITLIN